MISLIAAVALLQQETAEQTFARIEQSLEKAKTAKVTCRLAISQGGREMTIAGALLLKEGNKAKITIKGAKGDPWSVSDGKKLTVDAFQAAADGAEFDTPQNLNVRVSAAFVRRGFLDLTELPNRIRVHGTDPKEKLKVSDLKFGEKDGHAETLTYTLEEGTGRAVVKLWYDPAGPTLKKRTLLIAAAPQATVTETYDEFTLNKEIPDETFKP
jgi:outer membrane lipoprotein-sorting protein